MLNKIFLGEQNVTINFHELKIYCEIAMPILCESVVTLWFCFVISDIALVSQIEGIKDEFQGLRIPLPGCHQYSLPVLLIQSDQFQPFHTTQECQPVVLNILHGLNNKNKLKNENNDVHVSKCTCTDTTTLNFVFQKNLGQIPIASSATIILRGSNIKGD